MITTYIFSSIRKELIIYSIHDIRSIEAIQDIIPRSYSVPETFHVGSFNLAEDVIIHTVLKKHVFIHINY